MGFERRRRNDRTERLVDELVNELGHFVDLVADLGPEGRELLLDLLEVRLDERRFENGVVGRRGGVGRRSVVVESENVGRSGTDVLIAEKAVE